jgi:hypothetical protein
MAHRNSAAIACVIAAIACAPDPIRVDVPFVATDRSAVVVVEQGPIANAYAIDAQKRDEMPVLERIENFSGEPSIRVTAFLFAETLASLGLVAGPLEPVPEKIRSTELSGMREISELTIAKNGAGAWQTIERANGAASMLRIPVPKPCKSVMFTRSDLNDEPYFAGMVPLTSTSALALVHGDIDAREGTFYELSATRAEKLDLTIPDFTPRQMMLARDGTIYISGGNILTAQGELWAGDLRRGFQRVTPDGAVIPFGWVWAMETPYDDQDPATFYALTEYGQLLRFEDNRWTTLASITPTPFGGDAALVVNGRDDLYAISPNGRALFRYRDQMLIEEDTPVSPDLRNERDKLTGLGRAPDYGVFVGSDKGYFMERHVDGWRQVNEKALIAEISIRAFAQLPSGGLLIGGGYGAIVQYYRTWGLCDDPETGDVYYVSNRASVNRLLPMPGGLFLGGVENTTQTDRIIYLGWLVEIP